VRLGYAASDYPSETTAPETVATGIGKDEETGKPVAWLESRSAAGLDHFRWSLSGDGSLRLDYNYTLNGDSTVSSAPSRSRVWDIPAVSSAAIEAQPIESGK
jgi:hypothetical protein